MRLLTSLLLFLLIIVCGYAAKVLQIASVDQYGSFFDDLYGIKLDVTSEYTYRARYLETEMEQGL